MSGKIICIWGSPSSGKSVLSLAIAAKFASMKKNVIVYNGDKFIPSLKFYVPSKHITSKESIGPLLMAENYDNDAVMSHIVFHPQSEYIGFMGLSPDENYITYRNFSRESVIKLLNKMTVKADYVIIDSTSNPFDDTMTLTALELADIRIRIITPDNKGLIYARTSEAMYGDKKFYNDNTIKVLGNVKPVSPVNSIEYDYILPYSDDVETKLIEGSLISNLSRFNGMKFEKEIRKIVERIEKFE